MQTSLYDRLGGKDAIVAVIDDFVGRAAQDDRINAKFGRTDVPRLKAMLVDQVSAASGGPGTYTGRDMRETHAGMGVTAGEFDALVADLVATMDHFSVRKPEQDELLGLLGPMRPDIVEVESPETGTSLPAVYRPAPPLARTQSLLAHDRVVGWHASVTVRPDPPFSDDYVGACNQLAPAIVPDRQSQFAIWSPTRTSAPIPLMIGRWSVRCQ